MKPSTTKQTLAHFVSWAAKHKLAFGSMVVLFGLLAVIVGSWLSWRFQLHRLRFPNSVADETGLHLPSNVRIKATRADIFSLVDGDNYKWLIQSDTSLLPWATSNMFVERGGWEDVRLLGELGDFKDEIPREAKFGGVWRAFRKLENGREETSYLFIAEDGRFGILETYRP